MTRPLPRAFTLVELLVAISIVLILASLTFLGAKRVKLRGYQMTSANNLRQWSLALLASLPDREYTLPADGQGQGKANVTDPNAWFNVLPAYMGGQSATLLTLVLEKRIPRPGQKSVWVNPAVPASKAPKSSSSVLFCYAVNYYFTDNANTARNPIKLGSVVYPSSTVFMAETAEVDFSVCNPKYIQAYFGTGVLTGDRNAAANVAFIDGHVELVPRHRFDPNFGAKSEQDPPESGSLNFVLYPGATH